MLRSRAVAALAASILCAIVRIHGGATAIVSGRRPILNRAENRPYDFRWVQVYVRDGNRWRLAVSQATRLPTPAR